MCNKFEFFLWTILLRYVIIKESWFFLFSIFSFVTVGSVEDAEAVINNFNNTMGQRIRVSYSEKSAKDYNKPCTSNKAEDDFYLSLFKDPRLKFQLQSSIHAGYMLQVFLD